TVRSSGHRPSQYCLTSCVARARTSLTDMVTRSLKTTSRAVLCANSISAPASAIVTASKPGAPDPAALNRTLTVPFESYLKNSEEPVLDAVKVRPLSSAEPPSRRTFPSVPITLPTRSDIDSGHVTHQPGH